MVAGQEKHLVRGFDLRLKQAGHVLLGMASPIHIVTEEDETKGFPAVTAKDPLRGLEITVGVPDENGLPLGREGDKPPVPLEKRSCPLQKIFTERHPPAPP